MKTYRVTGCKWPLTATQAVGNTERHQQYYVNKRNTYDLYVTQLINNHKVLTRDTMLKLIRQIHRMMDPACCETTVKMWSKYWITYAVRHGVIEEVA